MAHRFWTKIGLCSRCGGRLLGAVTNGRHLFHAINFFLSTVIILLTWPAAAAGVAEYILQMDAGRSRIRPDISSVARIKIGERSLTIYLFVGDVLDPIRKNSPTSIDGQIISTNIQMNFRAHNPNLLGSWREALPSRTKTQLEGQFREMSERGYRYGQGIPMAESVQLPSGPRQFCFVVTDHENGWSWETHFIEKNLQLASIALGTQQCFTALATQATSVLTPTIGASQISRGDNKSPIRVQWARDKHLCRLQKSIRGILAGLSETANILDANSKLEEVGIVVYYQDVLRAVPPSRAAGSADWEYAGRALMSAFALGTKGFDGPGTPTLPPTRANGIALIGEDCEQIGP